MTNNAITEEEAKKRWCPFARVLDGTSCYVVNRYPAGQPDEGSLCLASECMAWRKVFSADFDKDGNLPGYCGLAGAYS